jgi:excisionase family DNA binding protein
MTELPLVLTVPEVAKVLRISRGAAYEAVRCGDIPSVRVGRRTIRVPRHRIVELLEGGDASEIGEAPPKS